MIEVEKLEQWRGEDVVDRDGEKVGKLDDVFTDQKTGEPGLVSIKSGMFGRKSKLVPLDGASLSRDFLRLDTSKEEIDDAPQAGAEDLDRDSEKGLFGHYGKQAPERSADDDGGSRFQSAALREERNDEAAKLREEADKLKDKAQQKDEKASEAAAGAEQQRERKSAAEGERDDADKRAEELRSEADELEQR